MSRICAVLIVAGSLIVATTGVAFGQNGEVIPPQEEQNGKSVLADIQTRVDKIQTLKADVEFDRKSDDAKKANKKKKNNKKNNKSLKPANATPWMEPDGREVERGPLELSRGLGARLFLERKKGQELFVANRNTIWKHDIDDKEAKHIPANWPVIDTFVANALKINIFVSMDTDSIKFKGTQMVDGVPCWLLEGKSPSKLSVVGVESTKLKIWVGKEDGIPRLISVPSESDTKIRLSNLQLNVPIDASRFQYTPPADVKTKNILGF